MAENIFDKREKIKRTIEAQRAAGESQVKKPQVNKPQKRRKKTKKGKKPLCQTNIFIQCPATSKSVRKKTDNAQIRRGRKLPPRKSQTQIEVEAEEKRRKLAQQDRFLELEDFRQQREFLRAAQDRQQRELQRQTDFISGQNRILADARIAEFNQAQENLRAGQRDLQRIQDRQLEQDRLTLQRRKIDNQFETNREQRALEYARIDADTDRYNAEVRRAETNRDRDIAIKERELADVRERVARDDAFRHRQLQETQKLAFEQLAAQQRDNERRHQLEQNRIDNQRAVDAERAITDREKEQTLQAALTASRFQGPPEQLETPVAQETQTETPARLQRRAEFLETAEGLSPPTVLKPETGKPKQPETPQTPGTLGSGVARRAKKAAVEAGLRPDPDVRLEVASETSSSSSESSLADPQLRRARNIQDRIARGTPTFTTKEGKVKPKFSEGERERIKARAEKRKQRAEEKPQPEPETEGQTTTLATGAGKVEELQEQDTLRTGE